MTLSRIAACPPPVDSADAGVPWHFGEPHREYHDLLSGEALVDLSHRRVISVTGSDRRSWLHTITTAYLLDLKPGDSATSLVLSPHGHVEHELHVIDTEGAVLLIVEPTAVAALLDYCNAMRFLLDVQFADVSATLTVLGAGSGHVGTAPNWKPPLAFGLPKAPDAETAKYVPTRPDTWTVRELIVPAADADSLLASSATAGTWAWEAARIGAGVPRLGFETDHRTIPHEVGWVPAAVHLEKGCYRGQETVARVHNLGRPPRRLVLLHLEGSDDAMPELDSPVVLGGKAVGRITSTSRHPVVGPLALAVVKRSTPVGATLEVADMQAAQEMIVVA